MKKITYELKTITPVYCKGFDNSKIELRPASFKGMIRYWFRALTAERDLKELHKKENEIFGSTKKSSKFAIRIRDINLINKKNNLGDYYLLPHKENNRNENPVPIKVLNPGLSFNLEFAFRSFEDDLITKIKNIFTLSLLLGGIGQRSRRGFGSIEDKDWDFNNKEELLKKIAGILQDFGRQVEVKDGEYIRVIDNERYSYPVIKEIYIGKPEKDYNQLLKNIGQATHVHDDPTLGNFDPRMASPVYVTVVKIKDDYYSLITKLEPIYPKGIKGNADVLKKFIDELR